MSAATTEAEQQQLLMNNVKTSVKEHSELMASYDPSRNRTLPILTRYERAKLLGLRTEQISRGSTPLVTADNEVTRAAVAEMTSSELAAEELVQKATPIVVVRTLPDGAREYWKVSDMALLSDS